MASVAWLKVGHFFSLAWTWFKGHWYLFILLAALVYAIIFAKNKADNYNTLMKEFQDQLARNRQEIDQLRQLQEQELAQQAAINQRYNEVLTKIQQDYQSAMATLDASRRKELQNIIANTHDDPDEMARQVNSLFGLPILPLNPPTPTPPSSQPSH